MEETKENVEVVKEEGPKVEDPKIETFSISSDRIKEAEQPKVNKMTTGKETEEVKLGRGRQTKDGKYNAKPPDVEELEEAEKKARSKVAGKNQVTVKTKVGRMHYFAADVWIENRPTVVPKSKWLDMQIEAGKVVEV